MAQIFSAFFLTSIIGTILSLILIALKPVTRRFFSAGWHYYMWLIVLLVMVLPIRLNLPEKPVTTPPISETATITDNLAENTETPIIDTQPEQIIQAQPTQSEKVSTIQAIKNFLITNLQLFSFIWLMSAVLLFLIKMVGYLVFLIKIHKHSKTIYCPEVVAYTNRKIKTRESDTICSPLMIGIIRPTLLLPKTNITSEQLNNVLAHEMTHLKKNDILYKWFVSIVKCIHWFNPAIYLISKQINIDCEISCDLAVVKEMNEQQKKGYVETILALLTHNNSKAIPLTTGMTGSKKLLKRRFTMIKKRKNIGKVTQILSIILAVAILGTSVFTSGILATAVFEENSNIQFTCNGSLINFINKPFYENNTVYLPLRELLNKVGIMNHKNSSIEWNDGRIVIRLAYDDDVITYDNNGNENGRKIQTLNFCYAFEIGKTEFVINPQESPMSSSNNPAYIAHLSAKTEMRNAPLLKNNTTYVPYEYIDRMLGLNMRGLGSDGVYGPYNIICIVDIENPIAYITPALTWPSESETISNTFGKRVHPITGEERIHNGIDISAPENSPVISSIYGYVTDTGYDKKFGNYIIIENDNGIRVYYGHLSSVEVEKGDKVKQRAIIGKVGKTGMATGANLHFEMQINGEYYNPELLFHLPKPINTKSITGTENATRLTSSLASPTTSAQQISLEKPSYQLADNSIKIKTTESLDNSETLILSYLTLKQGTDLEAIEHSLKQSGLRNSKGGSADLSKNYIFGKCESGDSIKTQCDSNGNITLYFNSTQNDYVDIAFKDSETGKIVGEYGIMPDMTKTYSFMGFEKGREYTIQIHEQVKRDINYIIF